MDVDDLAGEVTGPTTATVIANNAVTSAKIAPNTIIADDINTGAVTSAEILNATILAEDLNQMGAANDQVLKWNGTAWAPAADAGGTVYTAGIGLSLNGTDFDVDDLAGEVTGPTSATVIANDAVTSAKIANGTIAAVDLNQMGAANDQVLKWNGTAWAPAADAGGTVYTAGIGLSLNGTDFDVDDLAGEVTGPTSATVIANDAVTSAKIANGTIAAVDLNQMGAANNQVLKWNGTTWAPAADAGGTAYTAGDALTLTAGDFDVNTDGTTIEVNGADDLQVVDGGIGNTQLADNAVTTAKIANGTIAAADLAQMGAANDQVLKWNGFTWAPAADAGGTAYTAGDALTLTAGDFDVNTDGTTIEVNGADDLQVVDGGIGNTQLADNAVTTAKIANGTIAAVDLAQMGAANDQVLKWNGTTWAPAADNDGGATINNLATDNQTQDAENRTYNLNGQELYFLGGNIGIGLTNPASQLDASGQIQARDGFAASTGTVGQPSYGFYTSGDTDTGMFRAGEDQLAFSTGGSEAMRIDDNQFVGIFNAAPSERLDVTGNIRASNNFISGATTLTVPDYVFEHYFQGYSLLNENYNFKTLEEIEIFIKTYNHLPGIVSAKEAKAAGKWNLSESNLQNLEKIEELFLHTIEQEKKIDQLKTENESLSAELQSLRKDMEEIKALLKNKN